MISMSLDYEFFLAEDFFMRPTGNQILRLKENINEIKGLDLRDDIFLMSR